MVVRCSFGCLISQLMVSSLNCCANLSLVLLFMLDVSAQLLCVICCAVLSLFMNVVLVIGCCWFKVRRVCVLFRIIVQFDHSLMLLKSGGVDDVVFRRLVAG
jgi:hypothetical protein